MYANEQPRLSKRVMVADLVEAPTRATMPARNTLDYVTPTGERRIKLHNTDILTFAPRGGFTVNTGGWATPTTKERLNTFLPAGYRVHSYGGRFHLNDVPFIRECRVTAAGAIKPDISPKADAKLTKQIDAYMKAYRTRGLPRAEDSDGDPWVFTKGKVERDVMLDWIRSKYVFRLLYVLALQYAGLNDHGIAYSVHLANSGRGLDDRDYRRIRRYIRACLGLVA